MLIFLRTRLLKPFMRNLFVILSITCLLSACGLKGPLYLPGQKPDAKPPASAPAAQTDEKKTTGSTSQ